MIEISVIIPVYNAGEHLENSLNAFVKQTIFEKLKIILVNDGSTDESKEICESFSHKYHNFILINKQNGGVSSARNAGLGCVDTEYVAFFDADDYAEDTLYETLLGYSKTYDTDISMTDFSFVKNGLEYKKRKSFESIFTDKSLALKAFLKGNTIENTLSDKLFRTEIIKNFHFDEKYIVGEDMFFTFLALQNSKKIYINTSQTLCKYIIHNNSAMNTVFSPKFFHTIVLSEKIESLVDMELKVFARAHTIHEKTKVIRYMMLNNAGMETHKEYERLLNDIRNYPTWNAFNFLDFKQFVAVILMKIHPKIYLTIFNKMG
ncbi:glycosyltransferase family 2 protein [Streptococcus hongkongensis]|nr:hypothetical protein NC01_08285 [Streptococcus uberis]